MINSNQQNLENNNTELPDPSKVVYTLGKERNEPSIEMKRILEENKRLTLERDGLTSKISNLEQEVSRFKGIEQKRELEIINLKQNIDNLKGANAPSVQYYPPGHFYSPIPSLEDVRKYFSEGQRQEDPLLALNINETDQLDLLRNFYQYYGKQPFSDQKVGNNRYYFQNNFFSYGDGLTLHFMMRYLCPKRIIEIGSGFSSAMILDTNEQFFNGSIKCSFIEPYNERLMSLLREGEKINLFEKKLQDVNMEIFKELDKGDILFVDSTHVSKFQSDVNHLFFNILPILKKGVVIHIHDIFYPFEYPASWFEIGIAWSEAYILRAFLEYNNDYKIKLWCNYLWVSHKKEITEKMPLFSLNPGGSIWLEKV